MKVLFDTHALLWWLLADARFPRRTRSMVAEHASMLLVSIATPWEIMIKQALGKLDVPLDVFAVLRSLTAEGSITLLPVTLDHLEALAALPFHHRDPFDRIIVAQAIAEDATLVTSDARLEACAVSRAW